MTGTDKKLRQMEEEMNRFEAEIAHQTPAVIAPAPPTVSVALAAPVAVPLSVASTTLTGGFAYPASTAFIPHQLATALPLPPGVPMYVPMVQPTVASFPTGPLPVQHKTVVTNVTLPSISPSTTVTSKSSSSEVTMKVITAPPQMAGPTELAARAKEAASAASKTQAAYDDDDDDVTRALLAAAAGVTYTRTPGPDGKDKLKVQITKPPLTPVIQKSGAVVPDPAAIASVNTQATAAKVAPTLVLPPPPPYRPPVVNNATSVTGKKKKFIRVAAGVTWEDPTLAEWDPNDFRIFCGDLGHEVSDDTLTKAFNRYASFQKAKVVRDKRTGKSRGYGFVSFSDPADFTRAMREMNGKYVGNRPIKLKRSDWRNRQLETHRKKEKEKKKLGIKT